MKSIVSVFLSYRMLIILLTGFSSGLPLGLTGSTLQAWMKTEGVDLTIIGIFSLVGLPYTLKFLWSPLLDRYVPPFLGRRRGWMLITQIFLLIGISVMSFLNPSLSPLSMALAALCVSFFSASQDIVIDAYRTEFLEKEEYGTASGVSLLGYRMAMITSGAVALILADHLPWQNVYLLMAACMSVGILASFIAPEPKLSVGTPKSLRDAVVLPFVEFFKRRGFWPGLEILLFIIIYKMDVAFALALTTPFMMELGFSKTDIGAVSKAFGLAASIFGTLAGGAFMLRYGIKKSLWIFGVIQGVSGLTFALLARMGHHYPTMVAAITIENVCSGLATAAFLGFIMSVCDKRFTATQFALFSSLTAITRTVIGAPSGHIALAVGWEWYFIISVLIAIPGLLLLTRYNRWIVD